MSIEHELGLDLRDPREIIYLHWAAWRSREPALGAVADPGSLLEFLGRARTGSAADEVFAEVNPVMRALARLAATDAGNDMDAAYVLAWVMLPAAIVVVPCVQHLDPENVDKVIASNLWIVVRSFRHGVRRGDVAGSLARDLKTAVLRDMGVHGPAARRPLLIPVEPSVLELQPLGEAEVDLCPRDELEELLAEGCASGHIDAGERALLLEIVQLARETPGRLRAGSTGLRGLLSAEVAGQVALRHGIGIRQLRRRADRAIRALTRLVQEYAA